ncbi:DUF86 domain-containing protein [Paludisphaera borealis]|uniref:DUF86 domain-containing protein n=1 Tax=Paludisphaera borealis TaxID=1387353 RepID=A0A1U7CSG8_9BACT|nr:DUF86 domain-containing protein [Paludisphaera borealis]APW61885.1 hypothetical protein BSF38_03415 [Paludisphaera borealis]
MSRNHEQRIDDIIECCEKILRFTSGMNQEQLVELELVMDAVLRNLEVIGEATKHLPDDVRAAMPGVEWKKIAGMRDWISHVYYRVDDDIVWNAIETKIPELLRTLQAFKDEGRP